MCLVLAKLSDALSSGYRMDLLFQKDLKSLLSADRAKATSLTYRSMTDLAPVLTGCHVCRSPLVDTINKKMKDQIPDKVISAWLKDAGHYVSRITLGKHKREHLTDPHERARIEATRVMKKQQSTLKVTGDLASLVRDYVHTAVQEGIMTPTLAEGLRAQEMIDRRQEKGADREVALTLAAILGGGDARFQVLEAKEIKQVEGSDE